MSETTTIPTTNPLMSESNHNKNKTEADVNIKVFGDKHDAVDENKASKKATGFYHHINYCYRRFLLEFNPKQDWFSTKDPMTDRMIDIPESFTPIILKSTVSITNKILILLWKTLELSIAILSVVLGFIYGAKPGFYFAYLTHWSVLFCTTYLLMNWINSSVACYNFIYHNDHIVEPNDHKFRLINSRLKFTWIMFELGSHTAAGATILFWLLEILSFQSIDYNMVMNHGGVLLITLFDGMVVNRIPYRAMHWYLFLLPIDVLYILWTVIHAYCTDIGNPDSLENDPQANDNAIYPVVLEWNETWIIAFSTSIIIVFVIGPILFLLFWYLSIFGLPVPTRGLTTDDSSKMKKKEKEWLRYLQDNSSDGISSGMHQHETDSDSVNNV